MTRHVVFAVVVLQFTSACVEPPSPDGGTTGGGSAMTGGGTATGGGSAVTGGGTQTGGGTATGGGGGATVDDWDAGRLNCTFERNIFLGDGIDGRNTLPQVAMTSSGHVLYVWNGPGGLNWTVQDPNGTQHGPMTNTNILLARSLTANGDQAVLLTINGNDLVEQRFTGAGGLSAPRVIATLNLLPANLTTALESSGVASVWRQDTNFTTPHVELISDGDGGVTGPLEWIDAGYLYGATRANGTRLAVATRNVSTMGAPEILVSSSGGVERTAMPDSMVTNQDNFQLALDDDGTAVVAGVFDVGGIPGLGAMVRTGGTWHPPQIITIYDDIVLAGTATLGTVVGPEGRAAVVWWKFPKIYLSQRVGDMWSAPRSIADTDNVTPRFSQLTAARGLVHFFSDTGLSVALEVSADGAEHTPIETQIPGAIFGTEYVAAGERGAYIATRTMVDGGWVVIGGQCR